MSDPFPFTPVPTTPRHDGWTAPKQRAFIDLLAECGVVAAAAKAVGMSPRSAYALRKRPDAASFAAAWDDALACGRGASLSRAIERAIDGEVRRVYYRGRPVGEYRVYNNRLLIAALRAIDSRARDVEEPRWEEPSW